MRKAQFVIPLSLLFIFQIWGDGRLSASEDKKVPKISNTSCENLLAKADAEDNSAAYYARGALNLKNSDLMLQLRSLDSRKIIEQQLEAHPNLVWNTYLKEKTVTPSEIEEFKQQEARLPPQRKITFVVLETKTGRTLSVMRVYGSPFPGIYFGDFGRFFDYVDTDNHLPVELRYPDINFREETQYVFEAGRLAKDADIDSALERQFTSFAGHLKNKYGYAGIAPVEFMKGRIYIEITGRNLEKFLKPRSEGGYGFHLFKNAPAKKGRKGKASETGQKYLLYTTVLEFINNFYEPTKMVSLDSLSNQK